MFLHDIIEDLDLKTLLALSASKDRNYTKLKEDAWHGEGDAWHGTGNEPRDAWHGTDGAVEEAQTKERNYNNGDRVKLTSEYADHRNPNEVFTVSQCDQERRRCWIGDKQGRGWYAEFEQIMPARSRSVEEGFDFDKLTSQQKAHEYNIDAAQRDMDRRHSQGEDMTGARIDKKTYEIIKPKKQFNEIFADQGVEEGKDPTTDSYQDARGNHRGQVKKNKDGSYYVATNQAGSSKGFTSEKAAKAHANSGEQEEAEQINEIFADQGSGSTAKDSAAWEKRRNAVEKMLAKKKHAANGFDDFKWPEGQLEKIVKQLHKISGFEQTHPNIKDQLNVAREVGKYLRRGMAQSQAEVLGIRDYYNIKQGVTEGYHNNIMHAWNSGMDDDEIVKRFGQSAYDSLKRKYGSALIPVPDLYGYKSTEPTDPLTRSHRGLDGLGKRLKSQIAQIKDKGVTEAEGDADGLPHLTKELLQHIIQQVGLEGAHAIVKSLEWGDGAAEELLALILKDLKDNISDEEIAEHIGKVKDGYRLYSHKGKNLGTFDTRAGAEKHEREVQYFKHASESLDEDFSDSPVAGAITRRILSQRLDLLKQYGPELVGAAVDHVADFVGEVEEIGTSDVSAWVNQVERMLEENPPQAFAEGDANQSIVGAPMGNWYIRVNGKVLKDKSSKGNAIPFASKDDAQHHAMRLADKKRIPLSQIKLTKSWMDAPEQGVAEAKAPSVIQTIRNNVTGVDQLSRDSEGNLVFRKGFYYTFGDSADTFADRISNKLNELNIPHTIIDRGQVWKPFKGGATIKNQSHWWVKVKVGEQGVAEGSLEEIDRRGFLKGMVAAAVAGAAGGAKDVSAQSITSAEWNHGKMVRMIILYYFCKNEYPNAPFCAEVKQSLNKFARSFKDGREVLNNEYRKQFDTYMSMKSANPSGFAEIAKRYSDNAKSVIENFNSLMEFSESVNQGVAEGEQSHGDKLRATPTERLMAFWNKYKDEPGISPVFGQQIKAIANELARRKQKMELLSLHRDNYINRNNDINEATSNEAVTNAIINRIIGSHVSLLGKYGPEAVTSAAEDVAYHVGEVEEIGSSDVSAWVREVFNQLRDNHG